MSTKSTATVSLKTSQRGDNVSGSKITTTASQSSSNNKPNEGNQKKKRVKKKGVVHNESCNVLPAAKVDVGWLIDLRSCKEELETALTDPARVVGPLRKAIETARTVRAAVPDKTHEIFNQVERLFSTAIRELGIRELTLGRVWVIPIAYLKMAIERAVELGKTPLVVDNEAEIAGTFLRYQSVVTVDGKGLVVRNATKESTVTELRDDCRKKLVTAMTCGYPLYIDCGSAAPDFIGTFCGDVFPPKVFETVHHDEFNGKDTTGYDGLAVNCSMYDKILASGDDLRELQKARAVGRSRGCHLIVRTSFGLENYAEFLQFGKFLPDIEKFQVIHFMKD